MTFPLPSRGALIPSAAERKNRPGFMVKADRIKNKRVKPASVKRPAPKPKGK